MKTTVVLLLCFVVVGATAQNLPNAPSAQKAAMQKIATDSGWPRTVKTDAQQEFIIYQPQVEKWDGNRIYVYSAVEFKPGANKPSNYGVVWFNARTEVDKVNRLVTLDGLEITKVNFPAASAQNQKVLAFFKSKFPGKAKTISLDRLEAGVRAAEPKFETVPVKNDPPRLIIVAKPSVLVIIDGEPKLVEVPSTNLQRVLNTSAVLLYETDKQKYYLRVSDWWMETEKLDSAWARANKLPGDMKKAEETIVAQGQQARNEMSVAEQAELARQPKKASLKEGDKEAEVPDVYVVYSPAELIETKGEAQYEKVADTPLEYVKNTNATILRLNGECYILVSGRWFKSSALSGPWAYVPSAEIPKDFSNIPVSSPVASALASVPGTPQAEEGLIANSIPQTATITRSQAKLTVVYDGEATFIPIEGTSMRYARNTSVPVIKVGERYYAVEAGVWFWAPTPQGPWNVADKIPDDIYTIPPSSPLHYVTYAKIYGSTTEVVYVGYTPGYYGTVVSSDTTTVVYGTGWYYPPYVSSTVWYGYPYSYGAGAGFTWTSTSGWSLGFGYSYSYYPYYPYYPWWGPMGYYGCCWYPYYGWGAWGGAAAANVYGQWGNTAYSRTAAAWANPYTGNYGAASRGSTYNTATGRVTTGGRGYNTNIYTGNTFGYGGAATYNPNTGIVAGGGAAYAGNIYSGSGTAGRGGFAYNTNTNTGIAAGKNNVYAGKDGTVYRYDRNSGNWSQNSGNGWQPADRPSGGNQPSLQRQADARAQGAQRSQNFDSMRSSGGASSGRSYSRPTGRMGGGRRR